MTRGRPVLTLVTVTNNAGENLLRIASMSTWASIASRSGFSPSGLELYGVTVPLERSHAPNDWRKLRSAGPQILRARSASAGSATRSQNARKDLRASVADPFARA